MTTSEIRRVLQELSAEVGTILPDVTICTPQQLARVLLVYRALIQPFFVPLLANTWVGCKSDVARRACASNLICEISEDHPRMLEQFVEPALKFATLEEVKNYIKDGGQITRDIYRHSTSDEYSSAWLPVAILAALENTSLVFIPWMEAAAVRLGATELTYTKKHGVADIERADEFIIALEAELATEPGRIYFEWPFQTVRSMLLFCIFSAHRPHRLTS